MEFLKLWVLLGVSWGLVNIAQASENQRPHVLVLMLDASSTEKEGVDLKKFSGGNVDHGACRFSLGRAANVAGFLYGRHPMLCGVVSDRDWRRKPVPMVVSESVAVKFQKAGYRTVYWGGWGLGAASMYRPEERGFDRAVISSIGENGGDALMDKSFLSSKGGDLEKWLKKQFYGEKPMFCMLRQGRYLTESKILEVLNDVKKWSSGRPMLILQLRVKNSEEREAYFETGEWNMAQIGKIADYSKVVQEMKASRNVWQVTRALAELFGETLPPRSLYEIYHQASWPLEEAPEKHRYRGAMIRRDGYVLIDGLQLYRADARGGFNPEHPLDLAEHAKVHQELLMAYGKWWAKVYPALRNPRSFTVGGRDHEKLRLTALDWRASQIILKNGGAPSSSPPKSMGDLRSKMSALLSDEKYRESFPSYSGSWSVLIKRPGRYKITACLLPPESGGRRLEKGTAHVRLGKREAKLRLIEGSSVITVLMDTDAGVQDLECWFTGQLALERVLGAFFVSIERVGDKKLDLDFKPKIKSLDQH